MVKTSSESAGTMRAASTMSEGARTMIEHNSTMLESDLGTMVINSDEEEEEEEEDGTMKSRFCYTWQEFKELYHHILKQIFQSSLELEVPESNLLVQHVKITKTDQYESSEVFYEREHYEKLILIS